MLVYRVESPEGVGPYYCNHGEWCDGPHNSDTGRPMPYEDGIDGINSSDHRFGFDSMSKLYDWFSMEELRKLHAAGWRIVTFEIDPIHVRIGGRQLTFVRECATIVRDVCPAAELNYVQEAA